MSESFHSAARRLRADSRALSKEARPQTAGHLVGLAAECAVKAVLGRVGIAVDATTGYRTHFPELGHRLRLLGHSRHMCSLLLVVSSSDFLRGWRVDSRYDDDETFTEAENRYQIWSDQTDELHIKTGLLS